MAKAIVRAKGDTTFTPVSMETEVKIPFRTWLVLMVLTPFLVLLAWGAGALVWLYDAMQQSISAHYWSTRTLRPWWEKGGWVLILLTLLIGWIGATALTVYRFSTEQGAKEWKSAWGWYYPGKKVPLEERRD